MNPQVRRAILDYTPLVAFFIANKVFGIYIATGVLIGGVLIALAISYAIERRLSTTSIVTAVLVLVFGGLTLYLRDTYYLKIKLTVFYAFFAAVLLGGLAFGRLFIKYLFAAAFDLTEKGWRTLTLRLGLFYVALALINEFVRRNFSDDVWVDFKVPGVIALHFIFFLAQTPLLMRTQIEEKKDGA